MFNLLNEADILSCYKNSDIFPDTGFIPASDEEIEKQKILIYNDITNKLSQANPKDDNFYITVSKLVKENKKLCLKNYLSCLEFI